LGIYEGHIWVSCFWEKIFAFVGAPKGDWEYIL
jgi:hypothetical protein